MGSKELEYLFKIRCKRLDSGDDSDFKNIVKDKIRVNSIWWFEFSISLHLSTWSDFNWKMESLLFESCPTLMWDQNNCVNQTRWEDKELSVHPMIVPRFLIPGSFRTVGVLKAQMSLWTSYLPFHPITYDFGSLRHRTVSDRQKTISFQLKKTDLVLPIFPPSTKLIIKSSDQTRGGRTYECLEKTSQESPNLILVPRKRSLWSSSQDSWQQF